MRLISDIYVWFLKYIVICMTDCLHIFGMDIGNAEYMRAARRLRLSLRKAIAVSHSNYDIPQFAINIFRRRLRQIAILCAIGAENAPIIHIK